MKRAGLLLLSIAGLLAAGCTHVIPKQARSLADEDLRFADVFTDPLAFQGRTLLLGGLILGGSTDPDSSTLELLAYSIDRWGEPVAIDPSGGRLLVRSTRFLDPAIYAPGLLVTLTGTVTGSETLILVGRNYTCPVLALGELHLWDEPFRRGLWGFPNPYAPFFVRPPDQPEGHENPYDPGYAPYPYTPTWYR